MDFTKNNTALAPLFALKYPNDTFLLPNKKLPPPLRKEVSTMYEAIFGEPLDLEDFTLTLKSAGGELQKIYGPSVGKTVGSDSFSIKWGKSCKVLDTINSGPSLPEGCRWDMFSLGLANFGYLEDEIALKLMLENEEGFYDLNLPLRFKDVKNSPDLAEFKTMLKKNPQQAFSLLYEMFEGSSTSSGKSDDIQRIQDLGEGKAIAIVSSEVFEFTSKTGEEKSVMLLVDSNGVKYWSPDNVGYVIHLFEQPTLEIKSLAKGSRSTYVALGNLKDDKLSMDFGSKVPALSEKELPAGDYQVLGVNSFQGKTTNFISYIYTLYHTDTNQIYTSFAPSKHRVILNSCPTINPQKPASFSVYSSGAKDPKQFKVSQLSAKFDLGADAIDIDNLF